MFVGNNWAGTATVVDVRTTATDQDAQHRPGPRAGARRDLHRARQAGLLPGRPAGHRRGPRPVRRRHVHHPRRPARRRVAAQLRRRRLDRPGHRQDRGRAADGRLPHRPHGRLAERPATAGVRLHREHGPRVRHGRRAAGSGPGSGCGPSSPATPRTRTTTPATASGSSTPASAGSTRRSTTRRLGPVPVGGVHDAVKADRWLEIVDTKTFQIQRRWDMGKELAEAGYTGMSSAVRPMALTPGREDRVPAGLLPARDRRVLLRRDGPDRRWRLHEREPARARHRGREAGHPAAGQRAGGRDAAVRSTSSTPPTTASRSTAAAPGSASPARCRTTRRSSPGVPARRRS